MIPTSWRQTTFADGVELISGRHVLASDCTSDTSATPYLTGPEDFLGGTICATKFVSKPDVMCETGDILITVKGSGTGKCVRADRPYCISRQLMAVRASGWDSDFLAVVLGSLESEFSKAATGLIPGISRSDILDRKTLLPPLTEQRIIAATLLTWDRAIELTEKLLAAKRQRKVALMQRLLTGKVRLPGFRDTHWKACELGDVASNSARRIGTSTPPPVYSVTNSVGMVPMDESVVGASIDRYKAVAKHDFAYNPMRINVGSIAMWDGDDEVLVSPDYVVFRCGPDLDPEFLNHYRTSHQWDQFVTKAGGGSVRVRIYFSDLAELPLKLPSVEEQKAIAAVLNTQDREIGLLQKKLDALRRHKKGLMQQLLTGRVRVRVESVGN